MIFFKIHDKEMIDSLQQELLAKDNVLLALESEEKKFNQGKVMCSMQFVAQVT
jgi:hypothetical protein